VTINVVQIPVGAGVMRYAARIVTMAMNPLVVVELVSRLLVDDWVVPAEVATVAKEVAGSFEDDWELLFLLLE
jgi:hypothetical protein